MNDIKISEIAAAISFRQLRLFESVGRLESVRQGSEECNLSQPAVTQAICKLEQQLGVSLFDRRASGSYLTDVGKLFHLRVQHMFAQIELALDRFGVASQAGNLPAVANRISRAQVRCLVAIIENGSFPLAAAALGLTSTSLQRAARDLEGNLRKTFFHRTAGGVIVSPEGIEFGRKLKLANQDIEWGIREIEAMRGQQRSRIAIGALPFGGSMLLATVLDEFVANHKGADVRILTEGATEMIRRLRFGDVDVVLGVVQETAGVDLQSESFATTPFQIVGRRDHPLNRKATITREDLLEYDWVVGLDGSSRRACFDGLFAGVSPPKAPIVTSALPIVRHLLESSDRLTIITSYEAIYEAERLRALPFLLPGRSPTIGVTFRSDWLPTALHRDFMLHLRSKFATYRAVAIAQPEP